MKTILEVLRSILIPPQKEVTKLDVIGTVLFVIVALIVLALTRAGY